MSDADDTPDLRDLIGVIDDEIRMERDFKDDAFIAGCQYTRYTVRRYQIANGGEHDCECEYGPHPELAQGDEWRCAECETVLADDEVDRPRVMRAGAHGRPIDEDVEDTPTQAVGHRFYNQQVDEAFTVVDYHEPSGLLEIQYDDGTLWDEAASPLPNSEVAERAGLSPAGLSDATYVPLGAGPTMSRACRADEHDWWPMPEDLWPDGPSQPHPEAEDKWRKTARCRRCGLSPDVLVELQDGVFPTPWLCRACDGPVDEGVWNTDEHPETQVCEDCAADMGRVELGPDPSVGEADE